MNNDHLLCRQWMFIIGFLKLYDFQQLFPFCFFINLNGSLSSLQDWLNLEIETINRKSYSFYKVVNLQVTTEIA